MKLEEANEVGGWYIGSRERKLFDGYKTTYDVLLPDNQRITEQFRIVKIYEVLYCDEVVAIDENKEYCIAQMEGFIRHAQAALEVLKGYQ
jgi:hypothetical protein